MKQKIKILAAVFSVLVLISAPSVSHATLTVCGGNEAGAYSSNNPTACHLSDIFKLVAKMTNVLIDLAGVYAVVLMVWAGAKMVINSGNPSEAAKSKKNVSDAIKGFVLVMLAFIIVNFIFKEFAVSLNMPFTVNPFQ